ncbi:hypothetical protein [Terrimonas ferruginea]|uniref:hypothetical protein n=1 Tax=Terrimonas ferruginea TaxID=249 RepID=UPI000414D7D5|nr:hypothetical protein [Terrimonas ferruginea]
MKTKLTLVLLTLAQIASAQTFSLSSGITNTSGKEKDNLIGNGYNIQADAFLPFYKKNRFSLGLSLGADYTRLKNLSPDNEAVANRYKVHNTNVTIGANTDHAMSNSIAGLLGLQAQFQFGNFSVSPGISSGYLHFKPGGSVQTGSADINGEQRQIGLVNEEQETVKGILFKPVLKIGYQFTQRITVFAQTSLVSGPEIRRTTSYLVPQGGFRDDNIYEPTQLANGTWASVTSVATYTIKEINIGVSVNLGARKNKPSGPRGGAASASYAAGKAIVNDPSGKSISTKGVKRSEAVVAPTNEKSISEKGLKRSEAKAAPGNPIGGIIVKGGKNPGGNMLQFVSNDNGEVIMNGLEAGSYTFRLATGEQSAGKSISTKGVKRSDMAKPGSPIGGIVVKGGKNPGGGMNIQAVSNENGDVELTIPEAGDYLFKLEAPKRNSGLKDTLKTQV